MGFGIEDQTTPVTTVQWLSQGRTIPRIAAGGEKVGDVIIRQGDPEGYLANQIGIISGLDVQNMSQPAGSPPVSGPGVYFEGAAAAGDRLAMRVYGMARMPLAAGHGAAADGDRFRWDGTNSHMVKDATSAHELVGTLGATDEAYGWFRINKFLGTTAVPP